MLEDPPPPVTIKKRALVSLMQPLWLVVQPSHCWSDNAGQVLKSMQYLLALSKV